ncbi:MAG: AsmA family protein [Mizugakiibacter sp.]|uniref:AsmA family protein n=1 Tax=Mizugakiibacter sp. TaxID=1972610 RepID=UPI00320DBDC4
MPHRALRIALIVLVALLAVALAALIAVRTLLQPARFTALLQRTAAGAGLTLSLDAPAAPALWPRPALELQGLRLTSRDAGAPLLQAARARIVLPWRALFGGAASITRLELDGPHVDLDQLRAQLARLPQSQAAPRLPHIDTGVSIAQGVLLSGGAPVLTDVAMHAGRLAAGERFTLGFRARGAHDRIYTLNLAAVPREEAGTLQFDALTLRLGVDDFADASLAGQARWSGGEALDLALAGELTRARHPPYALSLRATPATAVAPVNVRVKLDGADAHANAQLSPPALLAWWRGLTTAPGDALPLPPLAGSADAASLDLGPAHVEGLRIQAGPDAALPPELLPAPAASAAKPAARKR